ncbi:MAG: hypothetical protein HZB80_05810 [Deltaproteobacteria bacterium]|nr:hypothetical protein [Deltaproteobacteria bacterium]
MGAFKDADKSACYKYNAQAWQNKAVCSLPDLPGGFKNADLPERCSQSGSQTGKSANYNQQS